MEKPQKFETVMQELETIIQELDSSLGLEESLQKFERGMALAKIAEKRLQSIENEFVKIQEKFKKGESVDVVEITETEAVVTQTTVTAKVETVTESKDDDTQEIDLSTLPF